MLRPLVVRSVVAGCLRLNRNNITRTFAGLSYAQAQKLREIVANSNTQFSKHGVRSSVSQVRCMGSSDGNGNGNGNGRRREVTYEELVKLMESGDLQLIDVREPKEVAEGHIPGSVNIPVGTIEESLNLSPRQFKAIFGVDQPQPEDTNIVFHCLGGVRSANALHAALELGYDKARHFPGGWEEWEQRASRKG